MTGHIHSDLPQEGGNAMQDDGGSSSHLRRRPVRRTMDLSAYLGYAVAIVMGLVGTAVTAGWFVHEGVPMQLRLTFGIVLLLMGVYRWVLTRTRVLQREREEEEDE